MLHTAGSAWESDRAAEARLNFGVKKSRTRLESVGSGKFTGKGERQHIAAPLPPIIATAERAGDTVAGCEPRPNESDVSPDLKRIPLCVYI